MSEPKQSDYELRQHDKYPCYLCAFGTECGGPKDWFSECLTVNHGYWIVKDPFKKIIALFEQILVEHVPTAELRDVYRGKLKEIIDQK